MSHEHDVGEARNVLDERDRLVSENAALRERVEALTQERDRMLLLLVKVLPEHGVCPDCGPFVAFDDDGCCSTCGADVTYASTRAALAAHEPQEPS